MNRNQNPKGSWLLLLVLGSIVVMLALIPALMPAPTNEPKATTISESELIKAVNSKPSTVVKLEFVEKTVKATRADGTVTISAVPDETGRQDLRKMAQTQNIAFDSTTPPPPGTSSGDGGFLANLLPILILAGLGFLLLRFLSSRMGGPGGNMPFTKHKGRRVNPADASKDPNAKPKPVVTFANVTGQVEAKEELREVVQFLKHPEDFADVKATVPRGVLLIGPPGTGKTLLARAVAGEAGVPFFSIAGSEFIELFVGVGAGRVRDLFKEVRDAAPSILFIDELDAVGRMRGTGLGGGSDEREQTLNQILVEMDGFTNDPSAPPVVVLAATNRPDVLDAALLRPGRFSRQVVVDMPDFHGRKATLELYMKDKPVSPTLDYDFFARAMAGMSQADIANVCNEAAILSARRRELQRRQGKPVDKLEINADDVEKAISKQQFGPERKSMVLTREQRENTAVHESGHAIAHYVESNGDIPQKITIVPTTRALGYVQLLHKANQMTQTKKEAEAFIVMALAGRAAQMKVLDACDTGASNDFKQAWGIARRMVAEWGMSRLGVIHAPLGEEHPFLGKTLSDGPAVSPALMQEIEAATREIIQACGERTNAIIAQHEGAIRKMTEILLDRETILGPELKAILDDLTAQERASSVDAQPSATTQDAPELAAKPTDSGKTLE
jgi:cell division protease FtsH